jgi:hypothetical protein
VVAINGARRADPLESAQAGQTNETRIESLTRARVHRD